MPLNDLETIKSLPILIVEDNADSLELLQIMLKREGYCSLLSASTAEKARSLFQKAEDEGNPVKLVLLDLMLPGVDGYAFCSELRKMSDIPIIMVTAKSGTEDELRGLQLGASDFVRKPFSREILLLKVEKTLSQYFLSSSLVASLKANKEHFLNTLKMMMKAMELRNPDYPDHSENTAKYTRMVAGKIELTSEQVEQFAVAAFLHDFGKITINQSILDKESHLSDKEYDLIQKHPEVACNILESIQELKTSILYIKYHHEHYDGSGYPEGLAGNEIPLGARVVSVAEAYDVMTTPQPYRKNPLDVDAALSELKANAGTQFDPEIVDLFCKVIRK